MGLWPFGREKSDVEAASRVVVLRARDAVPLRAKLTVKFVEPLTQTAADALAETCSELVRNLVREAPAAATLLGCEAAIAAEVTSRLPKDTPPLRALEVAGLHIIGDPGHLRAAPAPSASPTWLRASPSTTSDARPADRAPDRLTPIQPLNRPTPIHAAPATKRDPPATTGVSPAHAPRPAVHPPPLAAAEPVKPAAPAAPIAPVQPAVERGPLASAATSPAMPRPAAAPHNPPPLAPVEPHAAPGAAAIPASRPSGPRSHSSSQMAAVRPSAPGAAAIPASRPSGPRSHSSSQMAAVRSSDEPSATSRSQGNLAPLSGPGPKSAPPPSAVAPSKRISTRPPEATITARRRVVRARFPLPAGAGPYEVARGLTPLMRDTAGRILVAFLRAYDLAVVRRVPFDAIEGDILASLTAPSDGVAGTYVASHASEISRWRDALGAAMTARLEREASLAALALGQETFAAEGLAESVVHAVVDGLSSAAFGDPDMLMEVGRYLYPARETMSVEALTNMIDIAGEQMPPGLETALDPLFVSLSAELTAAALIAKDAMEGAPP